MERFDIYKDIAARFGGDIYLGVVGPVRTGKSTFITNFVQTLVLPHIKNGYEKQRAIDELPQSAQGKTIMTTQPKFVPNEAVKISFDDVEMNIRLVDCVGYMVSGALGGSEDEKTRMVKTPWQDEDMPFDMAAEVGTQKVISDHSNLAVMLTTDGSFGEISRSSYVEAEEKIVAKLKENNRPFVILLNTKVADSENAKNLAESLSKNIMHLA